MEPGEINLDELFDCTEVLLTIPLCIRILMYCLFTLGVVNPVSPQNLPDHETQKFTKHHILPFSYVCLLPQLSFNNQQTGTSTKGARQYGQFSFSILCRQLVQTLLKHVWHIVSHVTGSQQISHVSLAPLGCLSSLVTQAFMRSCVLGQFMFGVAQMNSSLKVKHQDSGCPQWPCAR